MDFTLSTQDLNRYGYRVMTSGAMLENFKKNPVMFYDHNTYRKPIGKWVDIRIEGDKLVATAEFDEEDETALEVERKAEKGMLNAASIGFRIIETSEDPNYLVAGQRRATVTKWELMEASIVAIPANPSCTKKLKSGSTITLSGDASEEELDFILPKIQLEENMKEIALRLGLKADATTEEILAALKAKDDETKAQMLELGEKLGIVTEGNKEQWTRHSLKEVGSMLGFMAKNGTGASTASEEQPAEDKPQPQEDRLSQLIKETQKLNANAGKNDPRAKWTIRDWEKKDPTALLNMKRNDPERYKRLYEETYKTA